MKADSSSDSFKNESSEKNNSFESSSEIKNDIYESDEDYYLYEKYEIKRSLNEINSKYNIIVDVLISIFSHTTEEVKDRFLEFSKSLIKDIFIDKNKKKVIILCLQHIGVVQPDLFTVLDLILFCIYFNINIHFINIFTHLNEILKNINNNSQKKILISYDKNSKRLIANTEKNYFSVKIKKSKNYIKNIYSILEDLFNNTFQFIYKLDSYTGNLEDIIKIKKNYSKEKKETSCSIRIPEDKIELTEYKGKVTCNVDLDSFWAMCQIEDLKAIEYAFNITFKITKKPSKGIGKNYYALLKNEPIYLKHLLYFKIGVFFINRDFPLHVFMITDKYAHLASEEEIENFSSKILHALKSSFEDLKNNSSYNAYLMSNNTEFDTYITNNQIKSSFAKVEIIVKDEQQFENFNSYVPYSFVKSYFEILSQNDFIKKNAKAIHMESSGSKRYNSHESMAQLYNTIEKDIDLKTLKFIRVDFALSFTIENKKNILKSENAKCLILQADIYRNILVRPNTNFASHLMENKNSSLIKINLKKLKLDSCAIERINIYSCFIPEYFDRHIRNSKSCQISSRIIYENMLATENPNRETKERCSIRGLRTAYNKLQSEKNHHYAFRCEFNTNLFSGCSIIDLAKRSADKGKFYVFETEKLVKYILRIMELLFSFNSMNNITSARKYLECILLENILLEILIKGTQNMHIVSNILLRNYVLSLISKKNIPLHNIEQILSDMLNLLSCVDIQEILYKCIRYSRNIPVSKKKDVYFFINIICIEENKKILDLIKKEYCRALEKIPENSKSLESEIITSTDFSFSFINLLRFCSYGSDCHLKKIIQYVQRYRSKSISYLTENIKSCADKLEIPPPLEKIGNSHKYRRFHFSEKLFQEELNMDNQYFFTPDKVFEQDIAYMSYTKDHNLIWSMHDLFRLYSGLNHYKTKNYKDYVSKCHNDLRYCFYGAVSIHRFREKIKRLKFDFAKISKMPGSLDFFQSNATFYNHECVGLNVIKEIYKNRYGVFFTDDNMAVKLKQKFLSYNNQNQLLLSEPIDSESQLIFQSFYIDSEFQPAIPNLNFAEILLYQRKIKTLLYAFINNYVYSLNKSDETEQKCSIQNENLPRESEDVNVNIFNEELNENGNNYNENNLLIDDNTSPQSLNLNENINDFDNSSHQTHDVFNCEITENIEKTENSIHEEEKPQNDHSIQNNFSGDGHSVLDTIPLQSPNAIIPPRLSESEVVSMLIIDKNFKIKQFFSPDDLRRRQISDNRMSNVESESICQALRAKGLLQRKFMKGKYYFAKKKKLRMDDNELK